MGIFNKTGKEKGVGKREVEEEGEERERGEEERERGEVERDISICGGYLNLIGKCKGWQKGGSNCNTLDLYFVRYTIKIYFTNIKSIEKNWRQKGISNVNQIN